jgi:hypothetical protein
VPALEIQKYLRSGKTTEQLKAEFGIRAKPHPKYPNLIHLSYDQIESPSGSELVGDCRGLILDSSTDWDVVAYPFRRFANYGEDWASPIDWESARFTEKLDGSLMIVWFYDDQWQVSTKGSPDASGAVGDFDFTFEELFWQTLFDQLPAWYDQLLWYRDADALDGRRMTLSPHRTYSFELTSPYNRVVCTYGAVNKLTLIGVRENFGPFREIDTNEYAEYLPVVQEYPICSVLEALEAVQDLNPIDNEGFVVVDKNFNRVKIKSPKYVELHHLRTGMGIKPLIRLLRMGETREFLTYFPEYQRLIDEIQSQLDAYVADVESTYAGLRQIEDRKAFALEAAKTKHEHMLYALHQGKVTDLRYRMLYEKRVDGLPVISDEKFIDLTELSIKTASPFVNVNQ